MLRRFQIFRAGELRDNAGRIRQYTAGMLQETANEYNKSYLPPAPIVIGHPPRHQVRAIPKYGEIKELEFSDGKLYAVATISNDLAEMVRRGHYKKVSAGFDIAREKLMLNHVAMVNVPAVKGMEELNFSDHAHEYACFSESDNLLSLLKAVTRGYYGAENDSDGLNSLGFSVNRESSELHHQALAYQAANGGDYSAAVRACIRKNRPND